MLFKTLLLTIYTGALIVKQTVLVSDSEGVAKYNRAVNDIRGKHGGQG